MHILSAASTDPGLRRESNEDSFSLRPALGLFVVADGMGGHAAGEVASNIAVDVIEEFIEQTAGHGADANWPFGYTPAFGVDGNRLSSAFRIANRQIQRRAADDAELHGMATTAVALLIPQSEPQGLPNHLPKQTVRQGPSNDIGNPGAQAAASDDSGRNGAATATGNELIAQPSSANGESRLINALIAHVGDSRAYSWRDGRLQQITRDHSWVEEQIAAGSMTDEDARRHPWRNLVTRALAGTEDPDVEITPVALEPGDRILLCSDGLSTPVNDSAIAAIIARIPIGEPGPLCSALIEAANAAGGPDNITVIVVDVTAA